MWPFNRFSSVFSPTETTKTTHTREVLHEKTSYVNVTAHNQQDSNAALSSRKFNALHTGIIPSSFASSGNKEEIMSFAQESGSGCYSPLPTNSAGDTSVATPYQSPNPQNLESSSHSSPSTSGNLPPLPVSPVSSTRRESMESHPSSPGGGEERTSPEKWQRLLWHAEGSGVEEGTSTTPGLGTCFVFLAWKI